MAINVDGILLNILRGLRDYTAVLVIQAEQGGKKPDYPFITLKWLNTNSPRIYEGKLVTKELVPSQDPRFEKDFLYTYTSFPRLILSVNIYDDEKGLAINQLSQKARDYFKIPQLATRNLEPLKAVVMGVGGIEPRSTLIDDRYERRQGFDVTLKAPDVAQFRELTIEEIEINGQRRKI